LDESLRVALIISAIGMTLLFLSLVVFYGMLTLLAAVVKDKPPTATQEPAGTSGMIDRAVDDGQAETKLRAAAVAIVLARAQAGEGAGPPGVDATEGVAAGQPVSAWWSLHHQRQITVSPDVRRNR